VSVRTRDLESRLSRICSRDPVLREMRQLAVETDSSVHLVGGPVRDAALGRSPRDLDFATTRRTDALIRALQSRHETRAFRFRKRGVTTWRLALPTGTLDIVDASRRGLVGDLRRRDFTVNAIAYDLREQTLLDPLGGLADLGRRLLRLPRRDAIHEDPVRAIRAARFIADLPGFRLSPTVVSESRRATRAVSRAAVERVRAELDKLLAAAAPRAGLDTLDRLNLTDAVLPELRTLRDCVAGRDRPDVWSHTLATISISETAGRRRLPGHAFMRDPENRRLLRWALLLHDISKPETLEYRPDGRPTFHGHEMLGARRAGALLSRLRLPKGDKKRIDRLIRFHLRPSLLAEGGATPRACRRLVRDSGDDLPLLVLHSACDALGSGGPAPRTRWLGLRRLLLSLMDLSENLQRTPLPCLIDGRDVIRMLELPPGPRVGEILGRVREEQDAGTLHTRPQALDWVRATFGQAETT